MTLLSSYESPVLAVAGRDFSSSNHSTFAVEVGPNKRPLELQNATNRRVSFRIDVEVVPTLHVDDFSDQERDQCWYSRQESYDMKMERKETIKRMNKLSMEDYPTVDDDGSYFRGLESKTREGSRAKQWNIVESNMIVMDEQFRQNHLSLAATTPRRHGLSKASSSEDAIAEAYSTYGEQSRTAALARAQFDARVAAMLKE